MVSFGIRGSGISTVWHHDESRVSLWCACDHVDEILVSWCIDGDEIPLVSEKLLRAASDDHTKLLLLRLLEKANAKDDFSSRIVFCANSTSSR